LFPCESLAKGNKANEDAKQLKKAVKQGQLQKVEILLDRGVNADAKSEGMKKTPLMIAIMEERTAVAKLLIDRGADVNALSEKSLMWSPLRPIHFAVIRGNTDVASYLVEHGAEVDSQGTEEPAPLVQAAARGDTEMVRLLVEAGADPDAANQHGATALALAAYGGSEEMASLLVSAGADLDARIDDDETLLDGGWTPLIRAEVEGHVSIAKMLIEHGADVNLGDPEGRNPLHIAVALELPELPELLIEAGAVVSPVETSGTDLYMSAQCYRLVAEHAEASGDTDKASEQYARAAEYFEKASPALVEQSEDYRKQKKKASRDKWLGVVFSFDDAFEANRRQKGLLELEEECIERSQRSSSLAEECREHAEQLIAAASDA
jgi:ankyrin repeat protein